MSDMATGIPIGMSVGFGGGFATGMAAGKKQGQCEAVENIRSYILTNGITVRASDGTPLTTEVFLREVCPEAGRPERKTLKLVLAGLVLLLGLLAFGFFLWFR
jgi:hypothetical protein